MKRCPNCKGTEIRNVRERFVDEFPLADGSKLQFVFKDFPQQVCASCGERTCDAKDLSAAEDAITRELVARGVRDPAVFKHLRKTLCLKATELAGLLGVTAETISRWENGHNEPDRAVWATLHHIIDDRYAGRATTVERLQAFAGCQRPPQAIQMKLRPSR
jgi:DNA-binding transcriptional regulator YiaG